MSGPVQEEDLEGRTADAPDTVEVREGRTARIGALGVVRLLPTKGRRTIGGWCFVDVMLPPDALEPDPMEIGPHPHIGLHTATWLLEGEALHSDSLGTQQPIRPGQLNLMTAGHGIAHAELSSEAGVHGVQMWIAQPETTRHGERAFEHHGELPVLDLGTGEALVFMGELGGARSPARMDTPLVGAEMRLTPGSVTLEANPGHEYAVVPIDGPVLFNGAVVDPGHLGMVLGGSETLQVEVRERNRVMLVGGEPLGEPIQMWWNFVARNREELETAWRDWEAGDTDRFPEFQSALDRIEAPKPIWVR